jgi:glycosyltransferase involved in cell wall biosynthesis
VARVNVPISVLHISTADNQGGSARAAYRIHAGLRGAGHHSRMLVRTRVTSDPDVDYLDGARPLRRLFERVLRRWIDSAGWQYLYYPSSSALPSHPWFQEADVVQLYNIHGGFFSFRILPRLSSLKPVVWRLSDMWALTGHCSYSHECQRWRTGCGTCPDLDEYPALWRDTTASLFRAKRDAYRNCRLSLVVTNTWMEELVRESPLLAGFPACRIPNGVDTTVFAPRAQAEARRALAWPEDLPVVLFLAHVARPGTRKGAEFVLPAAERAYARGARFRLAVMGEGADEWPDHREIPILRVAYSADDARLAVVYSAADLLLHPARAENFPNTVLEAMACGLPTVSFDVGGVPDAVRHRETGWLAPAGDLDALGEGIATVLDEVGLRARLARQCRAVAEREYTLGQQTSRYLDLYGEVLSQYRAGER